ncbi:MAG: type I glutamate--ammonia ligase [Desulfurococcales archaeon]|nr:type I glutamate--ammonia ligase [Desulfurococcales archaeon]
MQSELNPGSIIQFQYIDLAGFLRGLEVRYEGAFEAAFDGSSVPGFRSIEDSDLHLKGDQETLRKIPWAENYYRILTKIYRPGGERYNRDPRYIAEKVTKYLDEQFGLKPLVGVEVEFFLLDSIEVETSTPQAGFGYSLTSTEHPWEPNAVGMIKKAYHAVEPIDRIVHYRLLLHKYMEEVGYTRVEVTHHEVALAQMEVDIQASTPLVTADNVITLKWIARVLAEYEGKIALFMPKPIYGDNGSGLHMHMSLWREGKNEFVDENGELTQMARSFIAGILEHAESLAALVAPTTNSYRRLVPGYEAPVYVCWGYRNRSAMIRVPAYTKASKARVEFRTPDPSSNPYLAIAATIMAGLDGIRKKLDPGDPLEKNAYKLTPEERRQRGIRMLPKSLDDALDALESDNEYLKPVFDSDIIEAYIEMKRQEAELIRTIPHPYEFRLYGGL